MAESERSSGVQGDLEKELTCSVSRCLSFEGVLWEKAGKDWEEQTGTEGGMICNERE